MADSAERPAPDVGEPRPRSIGVAKFLAILSGLTLVGGMYFPLAVALDPGPSVLVYGILIVSYPAWGAGVVSGIAGGWLVSRMDRPAVKLQRLALVLGGLNLLSILAVWMWNPAGVS